MTERRAVRAIAHAKVNLGLAVGPVEHIPARGAMHPICSLLVTIKLADEIGVARLEHGPSLFRVQQSPTGPAIDWPIDEDLARRAHRLLERQTGRDLPVHATLTKHIPTGGGLGGGSSDAATMLKVVNDLFELNYTEAQLAELSVELGSDVAFFLDKCTPARPAVVSGLGDRIERLSVWKSPGIAHMVLVFPPFGCPTGPVYRAFDRLPRRRSFEETSELVRSAAQRLEREGAGCFAADQADIENELGSGGVNRSAAPNDLLDAACAVEPRLRSVMDRVRAVAGREPQLSGSGSSLFLTGFADDSAAEACAAMINRAHGDLATIVTRLI